MALDLLRAVVFRSSLSTVVIPVLRMITSQQCAVCSVQCGSKVYCVQCALHGVQRSVQCDDVSGILVGFDMIRTICDRSAFDSVAFAHCTAAHGARNHCESVQSVFPTSGRWSLCLLGAES